MPNDIFDPPALEAGTLRITPLGGLGEIGRNMAVYEMDGKLLIVDCGVLFPEEHQPGVDLILPDFTPIRERLDDVLAVVLTHGHEDHIGAVPYLLRLRSDIPLVGSALTLALIEAKLKEHRIQPYSLTVREGAREKFGPFDLEFIAVNHSIPDALAVAIRTTAGTVLHTGDFKMDQLPLDGRVTDDITATFTPLLAWRSSESFGARRTSPTPNPPGAADPDNAVAWPTTGMSKPNSTASHNVS
jgi:ribonuclease J